MFNNKQIPPNINIQSFQSSIKKLNRTADPSIKHHTIPTIDYPKLLVDALPLSFITTVPTLYASKANALTPYKTSVIQ